MERNAASRPAPSELTHTFRLGEKRLRVAGEELVVEASLIYFPEYDGPPPKQTWRKPIVGPPERPFAELQVVQRLEDEGWRAAWVHRPGTFIRSWEPREDVRFQRAALALLERIQKRVGTQAGRWDVFAWKDGKPRFIELKRTRSSDRLQSSQVTWRKAALKEGIPSSAFELMEWSGGSFRGRVLRLTSYTYGELNSWAECRNGKITYGGESPDGTRSMVDFYREQVRGTEADLLWFTYVRNSSGVTWCGIEDKVDKTSPVRRRK